jgi:hypothetical protein
MGRQAGHLLAETGVEAPTMVTVPCPLITRDSLGKPPVREL